MNELRVEIYKTGKIETICKIWKSVYSNSTNFVYEDISDRLEIFDNDKRSFLIEDLMNYSLLIG